LQISQEYYNKQIQTDFEPIARTVKDSAAEARSAKEEEHAEVEMAEAYHHRSAPEEVSALTDFILAAKGQVKANDAMAQVDAARARSADRSAEVFAHDVKTDK
jgi:hypothetical protein